MVANRVDVYVCGHGKNIPMLVCSCVHVLVYVFVALMLLRVSEREHVLNVCMCVGCLCLCERVCAVCRCARSFVCGCVWVHYLPN